MNLQHQKCQQQPILAAGRRGRSLIHAAASAHSSDAPSLRHTCVVASACCSETSVTRLIRSGMASGSVALSSACNGDISTLSFTLMLLASRDRASRETSSHELKHLKLHASVLGHCRLGVAAARKADSASSSKHTRIAQIIAEARLI